MATLEVEAVEAEQKTNILLVDDRPENLLALEAVLDDPGYHLVKAPSGEEALRHLLDEDFALILLDAHMPGMDGFETARLIGKREKTHDIPIIFITAEYKDMEDIIRGYSLKAVDYILKPFNREILRAKVSVLVELHRKTEQVKRQAEELARSNTELENEIAERKQTEQMLRESEERFRLAFGQAGVGMALVGLDWRFLDANEALCHSLGYTREELADLSLQMLTHTSHRDSDEELLVQLKRGKISSYQVEKQFLLKSGETAWFRVTVSLMRDEQGKPLYMIAQMEDITRRKVAEQSLVERSEALERSNRELEQFAYVSSHDLQEPLRMVSSYVQLLAQRYKGKLGTDADDFITYAVEGSTRMRKLINGLLAYSRLSTGDKDFEPADCEVVFTEVLTNLEAAIEESGAMVTHDSLPTVMADNRQLVQLFQNLIGNAIKFHGEDPPHVHVSVKRNGNEWVFSTRDNGIGIDPEYADRIFVIFQRLHGREAYPGTGIGLAICKKVVDRHGGRMWVESQPGEGSTFYFSLPEKGGVS